MSTDFRALMAQMTAELDHNRRCLLDDATLTHPLADRARYLLAKPAAAPAAVAEGPSDEEIMELMPQQMREDLAAAARAIAEQAGTDSRRAMGAMRIILNRHAVDLALAVLARWGQPPAPPAEGEVAELVAWLRENAEYSDYQFEPEDAVMFRRAAELLERHAAPVPVPVAERPWEREGWCNMDGECWWCPPDGPAYWSMVNPAMVYGGWLLPHWAIHQPPQGGEVES